MPELTEADARLLTLAERKLVEMTIEPGLPERPRADLQALARRLREARNRARDIASRQKREMRGKATPRATRPARDNLGTRAKADVLAEALKRVTTALSPPKPTPAKMARKALATKDAGATVHQPDPGRTASKGMQRKASTRPTVRMDPREIGRVSRATKVAQARRDST